MKRQDAVRIGDLIPDYIRIMGIDSALTKAKVLEAFDLTLAPGIQKYVLLRDFKDGRLFCTMSSSVARDRLSQLKSGLMSEINGRLGKSLVKEIILR
jgi:hypothetical protein